MNIGTIIQWGSNVIPNNWLLCDGRAVSRTTYADLFAVIGTNFGVGDGSTTFNLPDLTGRVAVGKSSDNEFDTLGKIGGEKTHTLTVEEMPSHKHEGINWLGDNNYPLSLNDGVTYSNGYKIDWVNGTQEANAIQTNNAGGGQPHNILQPYTVVNYIIKALKPSEIKVSELNTATSFNNEDYTMIVQNGENKKITKEVFKNSLFSTYYEKGETDGNLNGNVETTLYSITLPAGLYIGNVKVGNRGGGATPFRSFIYLDDGTIRHVDIGFVSLDWGNECTPIILNLTEETTLYGRTMHDSSYAHSMYGSVHLVKLK